MKNYFLNSLVLFLISISALKAQNWAPFQFDKKILYGTPDTLGTSIPGKSLYLVKFDTSFISQGYMSRACKKCAEPKLLRYGSIGNNGSPKINSLYGKSLEQRGDNFFLYNESTASPDIVSYFSSAKIGEIGLQTSNSVGTVISKNIRVVAGQTDSVKVISLTFLDGGQETIVIEVSKNEGFLSFPYFFGNDWVRIVYSRIGNFDDDFKGIKTFKGLSTKYKLGDKYSYFEYDFNEYNPSLTVCKISKTNFVVESILGDSCVIVDTSLIHSCSLIPNSIVFNTKSVVNKWGLVGPDSIRIQNELSTELSTISLFSGVKLAFISEDSHLFVNVDYRNGLADGFQNSWISTEFPMSYTSQQWSGGPNFFDFNSTPTYFKRGNTIFGQPFDLTFTSTENKIENTFALYPNPASDQIFVKSAEGNPGKISVYNLQGKMVLEKEIENTKPINIQTLKAGLYFYSLQSGEKVLKGRFLKQDF